MNEGEFSKELFHHFNHTPTQDQVKLVKKLEIFLQTTADRPVMLVKGYAGTGKTSLLAALVRVLPAAGYKPVLLAPTGRAAKVLAAYAGRAAFTIHKAIYGVAHKEGKTVYSLRNNTRKNHLFIVDEASMVPGSPSYEQAGWGTGRGLLEDLMTFVFTGEGCKLILIGDNAQLPPVHSDESPAMEEAILQKKYFVRPSVALLKEVIRQEQTSGILYNATLLRNMLDGQGGFRLRFRLEGFEDVIRVDGTELEDRINQAYSEAGEENTIVLCRSNKRANLYNQQIRHRIKWVENQIAAGDLMMVVKNNYHWLDASSAAGFIANGDIVEILRINRMEEIYGCSFADVTMRMIDYPGQADLEVKLLLNALMTESAALPADESRQLYEAVQEDYNHIADKRKRYLKMKSDPYLNALQVKFANAITCHKSQGGQWDTVFIDQGYLTREMINREYIRWLYTAVTRATRKLYLVNFNDSFFD